MKIWRPYTQMKAAIDPIQVSLASGAYLLTQEGRRLFDGISSWWVITHGHCHPKISEAISKQASRMDQAVFADFSHEAAERLSEKLGSLFPSELNRLFFSDNGSTAVEVAMKMAYQFSLQTGRSQKRKFVAFDRSYHGDTCGAMSVSGVSAFTKSYSEMRFEVIRARQGESVDDPIQKWTSHFKELLEEKSEEICAVLIEPLLQGAGGMIVWPIEAVEEICRLAKKHDVLVVFDEVMTGFGRTGTLFAFEQVKWVPDFVCLSKGLTGGVLPMGLTVTTEAIFQAFYDSSPNRMFFHGHSFTGNALSSAAAVANLEIFEQSDDFHSKAKMIHETHHASLSRWKERLPMIETRVCGTVGIAQFSASVDYGGAVSKRIQSVALANGVFIRPLGNILYLMPPYCSSQSDIEMAWSVIEEAVISEGARNDMFEKGTG